MLLRGVTLDLYTGNSQSPVLSAVAMVPLAVVHGTVGDQRAHQGIQIPDHSEERRQTFRQEVMLQPTSTDVLFALAGLTEITPAALDGAILYAPR